VLGVLANKPLQLLSLHQVRQGLESCVTG
jgi:hypothetical protein